MLSCAAGVPPDSTPLRPLTAPRVKALKPEATRRVYRDGTVPGLSLTVSPSGEKVFSVRLRVGRQQKRWTLGVWAPQGGLSLAAARKQARTGLAKFEADGTDPTLAKREAKTRETIGDLCRDYLAHSKKKNKLSTYTQNALIVKSVIKPALGNRAVKAVTRREVRDLLATFTDRGKDVMANRVQALISTALNYAVNEEWVAYNVAARIPKPPEHSRTRVLTDDELRALWAALETASAWRPHRVSEDVPAPAISPMIANALKLQVVTAQRPGECFGVKWADVELPDGLTDPESGAVGWWTIPREVAKNGRAHRVFLTREAVDVVRAAKALGPSDHKYVFAGIKGGSVAARGQKAMRALRLAGVIAFDCRRHDLRRTASTGMGKAGIKRVDIGYVLNHTDRGAARATQVYDLFERDPEKRVALEAWTRRLFALLQPTAGTVLPFTKADPA